MLVCHCTLAGTKSCEECNVYKSYYNIVKAETGDAPYTINPVITQSEKTLDNTTVNQAKDQVCDLKVYGDGDMFKLLSKASSRTQGWMKSTKAMEIPGVGCVVQVTTQQGDNVAEALTFVPGVTIFETKDDKGVVIKRNIIKL